MSKAFDAVIDETTQTLDKVSNTQTYRMLKEYAAIQAESGEGNLSTWALFSRRKQIMQDIKSGIIQRVLTLKYFKFYLT
jgi:hypothetical protein